MKKPLDLTLYNLKGAFTLAQQIVISSLIEEVEWLKQRVVQLERQGQKRVEKES